MAAGTNPGQQSAPPAADRRLHAQAAAYVSWSRTTSPSARTAAGRRAFNDRFVRQVDPHSELPVEERLRRADAARKAYFIQLARLSARSRRRREVRTKSSDDSDAFDA